MVLWYHKVWETPIQVSVKKQDEMTFLGNLVVKCHFRWTFCFKNVLEARHENVIDSCCYLQGYTIPLDKRLAADGRGLQQVHINENFAKLAEALYIADRKVNTIATQLMSSVGKVMNVTGTYRTGYTQDT